MTPNFIHPIVLLLLTISGILGRPRSPMLTKEDENYDELEIDVLNLPDIHSHHSGVGRQKLWPNGIIPTALEPGMTEEQRMHIYFAVTFFHENTCVQFVHRNNTDVNYLLIKVTDPRGGCFSEDLGMAGGGQVVNLDEWRPYCWTHGTIIHELMHAIGLFHEQARNDRDSYVQVHWNEIPSGWHNQFKKAEELGVEQRLVGKYDYSSVMHYGRHSAGQPRMTALQSPIEHNNEAMGNRRAPTTMDAFKINQLYGCADRDCVVSEWVEQSSCENGKRKLKRNIITHPTGNGTRCPDLTAHAKCSTQLIALTTSPITSDVTFGYKFKVSELSLYAMDEHYKGPVVSITHNNDERKFRLLLHPIDPRARYKNFMGIYLSYVDGPEEKLSIHYALFAVTEAGRKHMVESDTEFTKGGSSWGSGNKLPSAVSDLENQSYLTANNTLLHVEVHIRFNNDNLYSSTCTSAPSVSFGHRFSVTEFAAYETGIDYKGPIFYVNHNNVKRKFQLLVKPKDSRKGYTEFLGVYLKYVEGPEEKLKLKYELFVIADGGQKSIVEGSPLFTRSGSSWGTGRKVPRSVSELAEQGYLSSCNTFFHVFAKLSL